MAFITGTANDYAGLQTAIITNCVANGWTNPVGNIIFKGTSYFEINATATKLEIYGGTGESGGVLTNKSPDAVWLGGSFISFPVNYDLHIFAGPDEVYLVINYNSDFYRQVSFGTSDVEGAGKGPWMTGPSSNISGLDSTDKLYISLTYRRIYTGSGISPSGFGLFYGAIETSFIYTDARGIGAWEDISKNLFRYGSATVVAGLLNCTPNLYNGGATLLPIKAVLDNIGATGKAVVASLNNARFTRNDNILPGEIISYGSEQWIVYPWLKRNSDVRNGADYRDVGGHTGTFAFAIRYTGP